MKTLLKLVKGIPGLIVEWADKTAENLQYRTMRGREYWYVTDSREAFYAVPVIVVSRNESGEILVVWELGGGLTHEYRVTDLDELYTYREDAEQEVNRRNRENGAGRDQQKSAKACPILTASNRVKGESMPTVKCIGSDCAWWEASNSKCAVSLMATKQHDNVRKVEGFGS